MQRKSEAEELADQLFPNRPDRTETEILLIPPEQRQLYTEIYDYTIGTIINSLREKQIQIPEFQREYVWSRAQASRLVESLIIQCPIPVIYLAEKDDQTLEVIDGNQRLQSISLFCENGFALRGLTAYPELEGHRWSTIDPRFQKHILHRTIRCIAITKQTHPQIKFDVFERLNTGAVQLSPQELRHGIYYGSLIKFIDQLADEPIWAELTGIKDDKRRKGAELILRFFALLKSVDQYSKPMVGFLNKFLAENRHLGEGDLANWKEEFFMAANAVKTLLGADAFRSAKGTSVRKSTLNAALFDAEMVGVGRYLARNPNIKIEKNAKFNHELAQTMNDAVFIRSISASTSDEHLVNYRVNSFERLMDRCFSD